MLSHQTKGYQDLHRLDVVFFLSVDWDRSYRRGMVQAMARRVADHGGKVLCVERPVSLLMPMWRAGRSVKWLATPNRLRQEASNLFLYTPHNLIHDLIAHGSRLLVRMNRSMLLSSLAKVIGRLGFCSPHRTCWVYHPYQLPYLGLVQEDLVVCEFYDEYTEALGLSASRRQLLEKLELELLRRADVVFATSQELVRAKRSRNPNTHFMPEAVDVALFSKALDANTAVPDMLLSVRHPVIGFVGMISDYIDFELLKFMAESRPDWFLLLVGPVNSKAFSSLSALSDLGSLPNVLFSGWISPEQLPSYGKAFDVAIIPYRTDYTWMRYVHPLKLYEYTAMGKPVVATDIPGVHRYRDIIKVAHTPKEFLCCVEQCLVEDGPDRVAARLERVQEDSWDQRVDQELRVIRETLAHRRRQ